jgi:hypothetical protein
MAQREHVTTHRIVPTSLHALVRSPVVKYQCPHPNTSGCISISECKASYFRFGLADPGANAAPPCQCSFAARPPLLLPESVEGGRPPSTLHILLQHLFCTASLFSLA